MELDHTQEQKIRGYLDSFRDWTAIGAADSRAIKDRNSIPPLIRGGAVECDPFIGQLESINLTVYGRRLRVDLELASGMRAEHNKKQWIDVALRYLERCEACALVYSVADRDSFDNLQELVERYSVARGPDKGGENFSWWHRRLICR
ncbi:hypothetical protein CLAFUW4_14030 [Fulvia fulva]|uniref:Uncharacterized protein n=1 Tax=Passalora fulva TaxID=5499 RepID=A0A9Q8PLF8_PASFU|nr:uncharacterized protein CLAFUR5_13869 [Fulvia fulva]KAK4610240.1 hypothetical protein CLAFUR4_14033 [Fulvia fulva]KAK4610782.1 hypothetical protein CLAFUR0_14037 [Fulvia fulva]UJO24562.1 hypothetical protein CLAFUR5_13869 [Fulvia fulva]WPV21782.1 hypothetical protein CLAFUW4_14030 [Fulvia fulva]WPV36716.1 hypothetical protein CLAFUW7_14041 [Fulvia fulva]